MRIRSDKLLPGGSVAANRRPLRKGMPHASSMSSTRASCPLPDSDVRGPLDKVVQAKGVRRKA